MKTFGEIFCGPSVKTDLTPARLSIKSSLMSNPGPAPKEAPSQDSCSSRPSHGDRLCSKTLLTAILRSLTLILQQVLLESGVTCWWMKNSAVNTLNFMLVLQMNRSQGMSRKGSCTYQYPGSWFPLKLSGKTPTDLSKLQQVYNCSGLWCIRVYGAYGMLGGVPPFRGITEQAVHRSGTNKVGNPGKNLL